MESPFAFLPPAGGDVVLKSCEGTIFNAHSVILGLASTVFAGMFSDASSSDTIELAEDAETISLMLAFIYPITPPTITTIDQLEKVMIFSQKYDIPKMIDLVDKSILPESELIHSDPIRLFRASIKHGFPALRTLAAQAISPKHYDLLTPAGVIKLALQFPEASSAIGIIGAQMVRSHKLPLIVSSVSNYPRAHHSSNDNHALYMTCRKCWDITRQPDGQYIPGWFRTWASLVTQRLINEPMHKCDDLFSVLCFMDSSKWSHGISLCRNCISQTLTKRLMFEEWAQRVKRQINKELKELDVLYVL
ncbi:hypothetical protein RSOLAG1IB_00995 [Rhizoctonia solani AG-1 IB]|uniref:BTB domain-containing protein n=1 Tax=Thanatephorus cucumeris (strain AG1-IB / isolate 7/3/14) TaxID=1108050 RepID=A0A0B7F688_THACB|nr:hypothetical protein RSOLAG1IB_00995 [Rhizoctonia solani AG-1 IB]